MSTIFQIINSFSKKERKAFIAAFLVLAISVGLFAINFIKNNTEVIAVAGGTYTEGVFGQPVFINPIFAENNETNNSITQLVFSDLRTLTDHYKVSEDGKILDIHLRDDILWQDKQPITTDDIIFTINTILNPDVVSPSANSWKGIRAERISEREVKIISPAAYAYFENIVFSLRPVPKHIFGDVEPDKIKLSTYNLEPIGSGPFKFAGFEKRQDGFITYYSLTRNDEYFDRKAYLENFDFNFYANEDDLVDAYNEGDIDGMSVVDPQRLDNIKSSHQIFKIKMPRYYAIFLNQINNPLLKEKNIRIALAYATDKQKIIGEALNGYAQSIAGPIIFEGVDQGTEIEFAPDKAKEMLASANWHLNQEGILERNLTTGSQRLEFKLTVYPTPFLIETAKIIQKNWAEVGIKADLNIVPATDFTKKVLEPRNYEMLVFGNIYGKGSDPFTFWNSSQKFYPGGNLSLYDNKTADNLIESARFDLNQDSRNSKLSQLQSLIEGDVPAVFLYSPNYIYVSEKSLHGFSANYLDLPSDHLASAKDWYIRTSRILK